jgi:hypothetical protein
MKGRQLSPTEEREARSVFGAALEYRLVRIVESARWTDWLERRPRPAPGQPPRPHNAVTLGWHCCFPVRLRTTAADLAAGDWRDMAWLIHELAHAWQYQHTGWSYVVKAAWALARHGDAAYHYGGAPGLRLSSGGLTGFGVEQQAEIARDYCLRRHQGADLTTWETAVQGFRSATR